MPVPTRVSRRHFLGLAAGGAGSLVSACAAGSGPANASSAGGGWVPPAELLERIPVEMRVAALPGMEVAAVEGGEVAWQQPFGVARADTGVPVEADTLFEAASISKAVFAYVALQLVDGGEIDLDRPLVSYHRPSYLPDDPRIARITARHALTHSSGLPNWGDEKDPTTFVPAFEPGTRFRYSGEGYFWLQLVAEKITGKGLSELARSRLFEPAGMHRSSFIGDEELAATAAYGHEGGRVSANQGWRGVLSMVAPLAARWGKPIRSWTNDDWVRVARELSPNAPPPPRVRFQNAAASLLTTAGDYARFLTLVMARPAPAAWELRDETRRAMIAPRIAVREREPLWWGMGWCVERDGGGWRVSHEGNNDGRFTSYAGFDPSARRGLVVLANGGSGFGVYQRMVRATTGLDQLSFIADLDPPREA